MLFTVEYIESIYAHHSIEIDETLLDYVNQNLKDFWEKEAGGQCVISSVEELEMRLRNNGSNYPVKDRFFYDVHCINEVVREIVEEHTLEDTEEIIDKSDTNSYRWKIET